MPKAIFAGSLSFGLVNLPIKLYPATKARGTALRTLHSSCHTPLQHKRWCPRCEKEVPLEEVEYGFELSKTRIVPLKEEELLGIQPKKAKTIEIFTFVDPASIDPLYPEAHYHVVPQEGGERAFALLREILSLTNKVGVGKMTMRAREYVVVLRPYRQGLLLSTLHYQSELVDPSELKELQHLPLPTEKERELARMLVEHLSGDFKPEEYKDTYKEALMELVKRKMEGEPLPVMREEKKEAPMDLMKALEASLAAARERKKASG
ncbi:MAG: Ku protein [Candidatus Hadarchaeales archaeon]